MLEYNWKCTLIKSNKAADIDIKNVQNTDDITSCGGMGPESLTSQFSRKHTENTVVFLF